MKVLTFNAYINKRVRVGIGHETGPWEGEQEMVRKVKG